MRGMQHGGAGVALYSLYVLWTIYAYCWTPEMVWNSTAEYCKRSNSPDGLFFGGRIAPLSELRRKEVFGKSSRSAPSSSLKYQRLSNEELPERILESP